MSSVYFDGNKNQNEVPLDLIKGTGECQLIPQTKMVFGTCVPGVENMHCEKASSIHGRKDTDQEHHDKAQS